MSQGHYDRVDDVAGEILAALGDPPAPSIDDLAPADEFHLGGSVATMAIADALGVGAGDRVVDIGAGIGGPARRIATITGAHVTGVDLTPSFVAAATELSTRVGLSASTSFVEGNATRLDLEGPFDAAVLIHVGMYIADKPTFFAAIADLVVSGGRFVVYDLMAVGDTSALAYPLPFASGPDEAFVASPAAYVDALAAAGFTTESPVDHTQLALEAAAAARAAGPPAVSLATVMGPAFATMFANLGEALRDGALAPVQIVATR